MTQAAISPKVETSHAILRLSDKYILQLRDNIPGIAAPGQWSLFGGRINPGESPLQGMKRELLEELAIIPDKILYLWKMDYYYDFVQGMVRTWFFESNVESVWNSHKLKEGKAAGEFSFMELGTLDIPDVIKQALNRYNAEENKL